MSISPRRVVLSATTAVALVGAPVVLVATPANADDYCAPGKFCVFANPGLSGQQRGFTTRDHDYKTIYYANTSNRLHDSVSSAWNHLPGRVRIWKDICFRGPHYTFSAQSGVTNFSAYWNDSIDSHGPTDLAPLC